MLVIAVTIAADRLVIVHTCTKVDYITNYSINLLEQMVPADQSSEILHKTEQDPMQNNT